MTKSNNKGHVLKKYQNRDDALRKEIVAISYEMGVNNAAFHFKLNPNTITRWRRVYRAAANQSSKGATQ